MTLHLNTITNNLKHHIFLDLLSRMKMTDWYSWRVLNWLSWMSLTWPHGSQMKFGISLNVSSVTSGGGKTPSNILKSVLLWTQSGTCAPSKHLLLWLTFKGFWQHWTWSVSKPAENQSLVLFHSHTLRTWADAVPRHNSMLRVWKFVLCENELTVVGLPLCPLPGDSGIPRHDWLEASH